MKIVNKEGCNIAEVLGVNKETTAKIKHSYENYVEGKTSKLFSLLKEGVDIITECAVNSEEEDIVNDKINNHSTHT